MSAKRDRRIMADVSGLAEDDHLGRYPWGKFRIKPALTATLHTVLASFKGVGFFLACNFTSLVLIAGICYLSYALLGKERVQCYIDTSIWKNPNYSMNVCEYRSRWNVENEEQRQKLELDSNPHLQARHALQENSTTLAAMKDAVLIQTADVFLAFAKATGLNATLQGLVNETVKMIDPLGGAHHDTPVNRTAYNTTLHTLYVPGFSDPSTWIPSRPDNLTFIDRLTVQSQVVTNLASEIFLMVSRAANSSFWT
jgi:hypothetical protein